MVEASEVLYSGEKHLQTPLTPQKPWYLPCPLLDLPQTAGFFCLASEHRTWLLTRDTASGAWDGCLFAK